jgi:mono/diheme cytochrome c family protein
MGMMTRLTIVVAFALFFAATASTPAPAVETEKVFKFYCAQCHGLGGKGDGPNVTEDLKVTPRNFTNAKEMEKLSDADVKNVIMDGGPALSKSAIMPPWSETLSEEEVDALIGHLRKLCACTGKEG